MQTDLSRFDNSWYKPGAAPVKRILWYYINTWIFNSYWLPLSGLKCRLLRLFGAKVGKGVNIKPKVNIKYPWKLTIGDNAWIGEEVWIDNLDNVVVGNNCCISQGALLLCGNHNYKLETFDLITGKIILEEGVWVGAKSVVCPGVTCKSHSVLAVGSVATSNLEAYAIYQGNPAVRKKDRM
ncbi:MAG TPA: putative colanic acid biosynthesis acetyltransferase [Bacteroidales bacterium]|nr:putative colanic acid biosynthesis acetyltransferase [Bacteroidales bacterium]